MQKISIPWSTEMFKRRIFLFHCLGLSDLKPTNKQIGLDYHSTLTLCGGHSCNCGGKKRPAPMKQAPKKTTTPSKPAGAFGATKFSPVEQKLENLPKIGKNAQKNAQKCGKMRSAFPPPCQIGLLQFGGQMRTRPLPDNRETNPHPKCLPKDKWIQVTVHD